MRREFRCWAGNCPPKKVRQENHEHAALEYVAQLSHTDGHEVPGEITVKVLADLNTETATFLVRRRLCYEYRAETRCLLDPQPGYNALIATPRTNGWRAIHLIRGLESDNEAG